MTTLAPRRTPWRFVSVIGALAFVVLVAGANAHLVHVAMESQPECVLDADAAHAPAKRAC